MAHSWMQWWVVLAVAGPALGGCGGPCPPGNSPVGYTLLVTHVEVTPDRGGVPWDDDGTPPDVRVGVACNGGAVALLPLQEGTVLDFKAGEVCSFPTKASALAATVKVQAVDVENTPGPEMVPLTVVVVAEQDLAAGTKHVGRVGGMQGMDITLIDDGQNVALSIASTVLDETADGVPWDVDGTGPDALLYLDCSQASPVRGTEGTSPVFSAATCLVARERLLASGFSIQLVEDDSETLIARDVSAGLSDTALGTDGMEFPGAGFLTSFRLRLAETPAMCD